MSLKGAGWGESKRLKRGPSALFGLSASPVQESAQCGLPLGISAPGHVPSAGAIRHSPFTTETKASSPQQLQVTIFPFTSLFLLCPVVSCLLRRGVRLRSLPSSFGYLTCIDHHSASLSPSPAPTTLPRSARVLSRSTWSCAEPPPRPCQHTTQQTHRPSPPNKKPRARPVGSTFSPPTDTLSPPRRLSSLHSPSADSPISPREPQSQLPTMSRTTMPTGAKTRLMSELKTLRKENWINFEDVSWQSPSPRLSPRFVPKAVD